MLKTFLIKSYLWNTILFLVEHHMTGLVRDNGQNSETRHFTYTILLAIINYFILQPKAY